MMQRVRHSVYMEPGNLAYGLPRLMGVPLMTQTLFLPETCRMLLVCIVSTVFVVCPNAREHLNRERLASRRERIWSHGCVLRTHLDLGGMGR